MLGTNHYGHFLLSGLLFERIEESKGRIVVVASLGGQGSVPLCASRY